MAATGYTPIVLFNSTTTGNTPTTGNLAVGEVAINIPDGKLFYNKSGTITVMANANLQIAGGSPQYAITLTATGATNVTLPTSGYVISSVTQLGANPVTGTPSSSTYLRGDGTWATVTAGVSQIIAGTGITISPSGGTGNVTINSTGSPGGSNTQIQFNNSGAFAGSASLTWDGSSITAPQHIASNGLMVNNQTIGTSYSVANGYAASSVGPITLASGVSVTLGASSRWVIL